MISASGTRGWVLLELLIALCLFGLAVAPLWAILASQRDAAGQIASTASDQEEGGDGPDGMVWTWGAPQVRAGRWETNGALTVRTNGSNGSEGILLGVWLEGSFIGETEAYAGDWTTLEVGQSSSLPPRAEVVVRARVPDEPWGVPWRTEAQGSPPVSPGAEVDPAGPGGWVTVHLPAAGESDVQVKDPFQTTTVPVSLGGPSHVVPAALGAVSILTAARSQYFTIETGQHVDLYF